MQHYFLLFKNESYTECYLVFYPLLDYLRCLYTLPTISNDKINKGMQKFFKDCTLNPFVFISRCDWITSFVDFKGTPVFFARIKNVLVVFMGFKFIALHI